MVRVKNLGHIGSALILAVCIVIGLSAEDNPLHRPAVQAPPDTIASMATQNEGDEIDREIERYFMSLQNRGADIDRRRLERLFGETSEDERQTDATESEDGSFRFHNRGQGQEEFGSHKVVAGDTIFAISRRYGVSTDLIYQHNPELRSRPLYIGEEILISKQETRAAVPQTSVTYYTVRRGDSLSVIARGQRVSLSNLYRWNGLNSRSIIHPGQRIKIVRTSSGPPAGYRYASAFQWPLRGSITSGYGRRSNPFTGARGSFHRGIDIGAGIGTPFHATRDGIVILSGRMGGYGNCIFIRHTNGYVSVYAHNMRNDVRVGQVVKQGDQIGLVGRTGTATGPHLHFEVRKWRQPMNPLQALNIRELVPASVASR